jgi:hypothetical protein
VKSDQLGHHEVGIVKMLTDVLFHIQHNNGRSLIHEHNNDERDVKSTGSLGVDQWDNLYSIE